MASVERRFNVFSSALDSEYEGLLGMRWRAITWLLVDGLIGEGEVLVDGENISELTKVVPASLHARINGTR